MDLTNVKEQMKEVMAIGVNDKVKALFSSSSDDEDIRCLALLREICSQFYLYCKLFETKEFTHPAGDPIKTKKSETGRLALIRPCHDKYENKTFVGIMIGNAALGSAVTISENKIVCGWSSYNPAFLVPELNEVFYGCESWWRFVTSEAELKRITNDEINSTWYVKLFQTIGDKHNDR